MRSAVSTLLLFTVANEVTSGACRLILQRWTRTGKQRREKKCRSGFVAAAEFNCAECIANSTESSARNATRLRESTLTDRARRWTRRSIAATDWNSDVQYLSHFREVDECCRTNSLQPRISSEHSLPKDSQINGLIYFQHYPHSNIGFISFPLAVALNAALITHSLPAIMATTGGWFTALNSTLSQLCLIAYSVNKSLRNILPSFFKCCNCLFISHRANNGDAAPSAQQKTGCLIRLERGFNMLKLKQGKTFSLNALSPNHAVTVCRQMVDRRSKKTLFWHFFTLPPIDTEALAVLHSQRQLRSSAEKLLCHMGNDALISFRQKWQWLILDKRQKRSWSGRITPVVLYQKRRNRTFVYHSDHIYILRVHSFLSGISW